MKEAIRHLQQQQEMCIAAANDMQSLLAENKRLVLELNAFCAQNGAVMSNPMPITESMTQLLNARNSAMDNPPRVPSDSWEYDSPESGTGPSGDPLEVQPTSVPRAIEQYSPIVNSLLQLPCENGFATTGFETRGMDFALDSDLQNVWDIPFPAELEFPISQTLYAEPNMVASDPNLESHVRRFGQH